MRAPARGLMLCAVLLSGPVAAAAGPPQCPAVEPVVLVCSAEYLFVQHANKFQVWKVPVHARLYREEADGGRTLLETIDASPDPNEDTFALGILLKNPELEKNRRYVLAVDDPSCPGQPAIGSFSTRPEAVISEATKQPEEFYVRSQVRFKPIAVSTLQLEVTPQSGSAFNLPVTVDQADAGDDCATLDADDLGLVALTLPGGATIPGTDAKLSVTLTDVFDQAVKASGKYEIAVPKGKDDARTYAKVDFEAGRGQSESIALDLKLTGRPLRWGERWLFNPEFTAAVSKNVPSSENTMRLAGVWTVGAGGSDPNRALVASSWQVAPALEADRNLDRVNAIADLKWAPEIRNSDRSLATQKLVKEISGGDGNGGESDVKGCGRPGLGCGYSFSVGTEAGGSIKQQTLVNSKKTARLAIDSYRVLRLRPQVHAFLEQGSVTLDVSFTGRYLAATELAGRERADGSLELRRIHGIQTLTVTTLSYALTRGGAFSATATYKNGAAPPLFEDISTLSIGIVWKE